MTAGAGLHVVERIAVDYAEPRRGIYRMIPVRYTDPRGFAYSLGFTFEGAAEEDGSPVPVKVTNEGEYVSLRLGEADRTRTGRVVYLIRYRLRDALGHFPSHDELYWNATGTEWQTAIESASATVRLPAPLPADSLEVAGYTGRFGSRDQNATVTVAAPGAVRYEARAPLGPMEGLTIVAAWPRGHVKFPGLAERSVRFLADNIVLLAPLLALGLLTAAYRRAGRDPAGPAAVMVRYEPPPGVTPGEIGALVDERVDLRDVTATVVDLAVRGHLSIRMIEKSLFLGIGTREEPEFTRSHPDKGSLAPHERRVLDALFSGKETVTLKDLRYRFYRELPGIRKALYTTLTEKKHFAAMPTTVRGAWTGFGFLAGVIVVILGLVWANARGGAFPHASVVPIVSGILTFIAFAAFAPAMPRRTASGVKLRAWAKGFEEFVGRVETEKLEADRRRGVFESLLPYAMALGVAEKWADAFEGIYAEGGGPAWYTGPALRRGFSTSGFERSLTGAMASAGQSMTAAPRSSSSSGSSSSGGGFSGGGGGGGGGGSW